MCLFVLTCHVSVNNSFTWKFVFFFGGRTCRTVFSSPLIAEARLLVKGTIENNYLMIRPVIVLPLSVTTTRIHIPNTCTADIFDFRTFVTFLRLVDKCRTIAIFVSNAFFAQL